MHKFYPQLWGHVITLKVFEKIIGIRKYWIVYACLFSQLCKNKTPKIRTLSNTDEIWVIMFRFCGCNQVPSLNVWRGIDHARADPWNTRQVIPQVHPVLSSMACLLVCLHVFQPIFLLFYPSPFFVCLTHCLTTTKEINEQIAKKKKRNSDTIGSLACASEVQCLFWSYLKAATKKEAGISQPSLPPFLAFLLPLLSPSHTPTGDSCQCRAH